MRITHVWSMPVPKLDVIKRQMVLGYIVLVSIAATWNCLEDRKLG
jgi:hypothetical protein